MGIEGGTVITVKSIATSVAALAVIGGGAAAGIASIAPPSGQAQVQLAAVGAPQQDLPLAPNPPAQSLPTADQLTSLLTNLADPGVSYTTKTGLVEGGISSGEGHLVDHELRKAYRDGELPLSFNVSNIQTTGPNAASADVAISGPKLPAPVTKNLTFINQSGWVLSHDSATQLVQAATSH
jgi:hypothetical protein